MQSEVPLHFQEPDGATTIPIIVCEPYCELCTEGRMRSIDEILQELRSSGAFLHPRCARKLGILW